MAKSVRVDITARDKGSNVVKGFADKSTSSLKKLDTHIGNITKSMLKWTAVITGAATAAAALTKKVFDFADNIAKLSDSIGISTDALQKYQFAAKIAGVENAQLEMSMRYLIKGVSDSRVGVGTLTTALKDNQGLIKQLQNADSASDQLSIALKAINDSTDSAGLAMNLFGSRAGLAMVNLARSYKESIALAEKYGLVIDEKLLRGAEEANDAMALLAGVIRTKLYSIILQLAPKIKEVADNISNWFKNNKELIDQKIPEYIDKIKESLKKIWSLISYDPDIIKYGIIGLVLFGKKGAFLVGGVAHLANMVKYQARAIDLMKAGLISFKDFATSNYKELEALVNKYKDIQINPDGTTSKIIKSETHKPLQLNIGSPNKEKSRLLAIQQLREQLLKENEGTPGPSDFKTYPHNIVNPTYPSGHNLGAGGINNTYALSQFGSMMAAKDRASNEDLAEASRIGSVYATYAKKFMDSQKAAAEKFKKIWGGVTRNFVSNFQDAFVSVANGTKKIGTAFKELAISVIIDIERMIAKMLIMQALGIDSGGGMSGGGIFGAILSGIGGLFGGGGGSITDALPAAGTMPVFAANGGILSGGFRAFAGGGIANKPTLGLIGEGSMNEAVVPLPDGKSIPVKGGMGNNITNNINVTVDSKHGSDPEKSKRLAKDISDSIDQKIKETLATELRPGGMLNRQHYARAY